MSKKDYLGDSVYADYDGYHVILTTENGYGPSNTIALDSDVIDALLRYIQRMYGVKIEIIHEPVEAPDGEL